MPDNTYSGAAQGLETLLRRARLDRLLEKAFERPLVTVTAGAGCGKTCAVYSYLQASRLRPVWIQLSEMDNLPARFWENVTHAIQLHNPPLAEKVRKGGIPSSRTELLLFAEMLADEIKPRYRYALVFDDLHLIHESAVLWFIRALANGMWSGSFTREHPGNALVLISREDCGFDSEKLSAEGRMAQIREEDLNFTKNETLDLFRFLGVKTTPELLAGMNEIYTDTEGWAFLTAMAGRLLQKRPDGLKYIKTALQHNVSLLIENELFLQNSPEMNKFLAKLSLISHLSADLIATLENGEALMQELVHNTSLIRYDAYMHVYHVHHLLQDVLLQKQCLLTEGEKRAVYQTAAAWCLEHDYKIDAAGYFAQAGDYQGVIDIIFLYPQVVPFGEATLLFDILDGAPSGLEAQIPWLYNYRAKLLLSLGRIPQAIEELQGAIRRAGTQEDSLAKRRILMGAYYMLGFAHMLTCNDTGNYDFVEYFQKASGYLQDGDFVPRAGTRVATVAPYIIQIGREEKGEPEKYLRALEASVPYISGIMDGSFYGMDDLARAELAFYRMDTAGCKRYAMQALYKAQEKGQYEIENRALFFLMRVGLAAGKYEAIKDAIGQMDAQLDIPGFINRYIRYDIQTGWFYASIGQKDHIPEWLKSDFTISHTQTVLSNYEDFARCKYYLLEQKYHTMLAMLSSRTGDFDIGRYLFGQIGMAAHRAVCFYNLKDTRGAFEALRQGYELAAPNGLDMIFVELGNHMRTLAAAARSAGARGIPDEWLETMQKKAATYAKRVGQVRSQYRHMEGLEDSVQLTQKETDLLVDLSHGLSRSEIAEARGISINTVKMMLLYIYEKLGAENSMDAVRIAFSKGLL